MASAVDGKPAPLPQLGSFEAHSLAGFSQSSSRASPAPSWSALVSSGTIVARGSEPAGACGSGGGGGVRLQLPCVLRPAVSSHGLDLQLQLIRLQVGEPWEGVAAQRAGSHAPDGLLGLLGLLDRAAGLLAARLLFPDVAAPVARLLAGAHCASAAGALLAAASRTAMRRRQRQRRARAIGWPAAQARLAHCLTRLLQHLGEPALVLLAAAALWARLHPTSAQIGECVAALIPVLAGYNQTARQCAVLGLSGDAAEELWRRRHSWAARRTAPLLGDLPDQPPLGRLADAWEAVSICIAATYDGLHFGSVAGVAGEAGSGLQVCASASVRGRRAGRAGDDALVVPPGHVAAAPAEPLEGSPRAERSGAGTPCGAAEQPPRLGPLLGSPFASEAVCGGAGQQAQQVQQLAQQAQHQDAACGRASVFDSPSEMAGGGGGSPLGPWQPQQQPGGGEGPAGDPADFMHPSRWADARGLPAGGDERRRGTSAGSVSGSSCSWRSFLLPGRAFSSDAGSSDGGWDTPHGALSPASALLLPPGDAQPSPAQPRSPAAAAVLEQCSPDAHQGSATLPGARGDHSPLPLYGRGDHAADDARRLTPAERAQLALRAAQLLALFAPFLLLGSALLLAAAQLDAFAARQRRRALGGGQAHAAAAGAGGGGPSPRAERMRTAAFRLLLDACRRSGPAFIKWAQWSSSREDIFPPAFCRVLGELRDRAPTHSAERARAAVEAALGRPLDRLFVSFEPAPLASGSIAQVHRARMLVDGHVREVAVKVRHPGVARRIWLDFQLLRPLAALTSRVRSLRGLNLRDSVAQFSHTMTAQADLRVEAAHLRRFYENFHGATSSVHVPRPIEGYCTESVLVETFEPGRSVAAFTGTPHPQNTQIVAIGVDCYLKMLLQDGFVHQDLHAGNILVRPAPPRRAPAPGAGAGPPRPRRQQQQQQQRQQQQQQPLELVLLDFGLAEELTPAVRHHFVSFLHCIAKGDGRRAAHHLLCWSANQRCPDRAAFTAAMEALFRARCDIRAPGGIDLDFVIKAVLRLARTHEVCIDSSYAGLVVGVCVIVGFAASLDARANLMDAAAPCFLAHALTGRVTGRLYM